MNYISRLNYYKIGVKENLFDEITLRTIETYFEYRWKNIDVNSNKLVKIINDQQDLMFEVQKIQRNEYSFILSKDLKNTLSFKKNYRKNFHNL